MNYDANLPSCERGGVITRVKGALKGALASIVDFDGLVMQLFTQAHVLLDSPPCQIGEEDADNLNGTTAAVLSGALSALATHIAQHTECKTDGEQQVDVDWIATRIANQALDWLRKDMGKEALNHIDPDIKTMQAMHAKLTAQEAAKSKDGRSSDYTVYFHSLETELSKAGKSQLFRLLVNSMVDMNPVEQNLRLEADALGQDRGHRLNYLKKCGSKEASVPEKVAEQIAQTVEAWKQAQLETRHVKFAQQCALVKQIVLLLARAVAQPVTFDAKG